MRNGIAAAALFAACVGPVERIVGSGEDSRALAVAAELRPLLALYCDEPPGEGRAELLWEMSEPLRRFMERGGGLEPLAFLAAAAEEGATWRERRTAFEALPDGAGEEVVDWLLDRARSRHAEVRERALGELACTAGEARPRAWAAVARGLEDPDPVVRTAAARLLEHVIVDARR